MTKQELIQRVARRPGVPPELKRKQVGLLVDAVFAELAGYFVEARVSRRAAHGARFSYPGFGTFTKKRRGERSGRNPQTGQPITIPATTTVTFAPGQELKAQLNHDASAGGRRKVR
jgi:DNA-binding protein HU-beta